MRKKKKKYRYVTFGTQARKKPRLSMRLIAKWSVIVFILLATAVAYVWQRNTIISLGYRITELRKDISVAGDEELKLQAELVRLQRPQRLWEEVNARGLGLQRESPNQVMVLGTPRPFRLPPANKEAAHCPPVVPRSLAKLSVAAPHYESSVLSRRR